MTKQEQIIRIAINPVSVADGLWHDTYYHRGWLSKLKWEIACWLLLSMRNPRNHSQYKIETGCS